MFKQVIEHIPFSVIITDSEGIIEFVNEEFTRTTGFTSEEVAGLTPGILKSGQHGHLFYSRMWETIKAGATWKGEICSRKKDGEILWEIMTIVPLRENSRRITHFVAIKEKINELKNIELELEETELKFRTVFSSIKEGLAILSMAGEILQVNNAFISMVGEDREKGLTGRKIGELFSEKDQGYIIQGLKDVIDKGEKLTLECGSGGNGDGRKDFEISLTSLNDQKGYGIGYVVLLKDISQRKKDENELLLSEQRHRALVEAVPDLMFRLNDRGMFIDDFFRDKIYSVFPRELNSEMISLLSRAFETNEIQTCEYPVEIGDLTRYYEARFIVSGVSEVLVIVRNVTDRHNAEEALRHARDEAEAANRSKSEFLANMSHEIRTPLNSITGFIEILKKSELDNRQREYLDIVSSSASSLLGIINDILDFSKIESRKLEVDRVAFDPLKEFESVIDLYYVKASEKGIDLLSFIDPALPGKLMGDPLRIKQVMGNLLSNAVKFTPEKGMIVITIKNDGVEDNRCRVTFSVEDSGIGIADYKKDRIFEAFEQMDTSVSRRYGGTGLGLTIALNLVKLMGGKLDVESEKGKGSTFYFSLTFDVASKKEKFVFDSLQGRSNVTVYCRNAGSLLNEQLCNYLQGLKFIVTKTNDMDSIMMSPESDILFVIYDRETRCDVHGFLNVNPRRPVIICAGEKDLADLDDVRRSNVRIIMPPFHPSNIVNAIMEVTGDKRLQRWGNKKTAETVPVKFTGKILVAEDNSVNQMLMKIMLKEYGLETGIASNGIEAFDMYKKGNYDMILMDVNMPVADGMESAAMIRDFENAGNRVHVPVVALTARAMKGDREEILAAGMDGYLSKPLDEKALRDVLGRFLSPLENEKAGKDEEKGPVYEENYDRQEVASQLGIPATAMPALLKAFFSNGQETLGNLRRSLKNENREEVGMAAHKLKGACYNFRFNILGGLCEKLEKNAPGEDFKILWEHFGEIEKRFTRLVETINVE